MSKINFNATNETVKNAMDNIAMSIFVRASYDLQCKNEIKEVKNSFFKPHLEDHSDLTDAERGAMDKAIEEVSARKKVVNAWFKTQVFGNKEVVGFAESLGLDKIDCSSQSSIVSSVKSILVENFGLSFLADNGKNDAIATKFCNKVAYALMGKNQVKNPEKVMSGEYITDRKGIKELFLFAFLEVVNEYTKVFPKYTSEDYSAYIVLSEDNKNVVDAGVEVLESDSDSVEEQEENYAHNLYQRYTRSI